MGISIENRKSSAFRDIWARVMIFKCSKLHEPQASATWELEKHYEWPYITKCTSDHTISQENYVKNWENATVTLLWTRNSEMASSRSRVLFQAINYNLITGKPSVNFQENVMNWSSSYIKSMKNQLSDDKFVIVPNSCLQQTFNADLNFWMNRAVLESR